MRKSYLDNLRWVTVVLVVIYHVLYMYNAEGIVGTLGKITNLEVQYYDAYQYLVYPWFMVLLFIVSGISSRYYLEKHTCREFIKSRTSKLLVPSTLGLLVFGFIQGYINASFSNAGALEVPGFVKYIIYCLSGIGVLWYIQMLWIFSLVLALIKTIDKDRFWKVCGKTPFWVILLLCIPVYLAGQILNSPIIVVYRFGLYFLAFLLGYFVFSHDEVIGKLKKYFWILAVIGGGLCIAFTYVYFIREVQNYADNPVYRTPLFLLTSYFGSLAMIGGFAKFFDFETGFTKWMSKRSWGLYLFHYLGISAAALFIAKPGHLPAWACYLLSAVMGFALAYILNFIIPKIPVYRWLVMGISKKKKESKNVQG